MARKLNRRLRMSPKDEKMKWISKTGRAINVPINKYFIDWSRPSPSKLAQTFKDYLKRYCPGHVLLEEFKIPQKRLFVDFIDLTYRVAYEVNGPQHEKFHYFHKSKSDFLGQIKRDFLKEELLIKNGFKVFHIVKEDYPLNKDYFLNCYAS